MKAQLERDERQTYREAAKEVAAQAEELQD